MTARANSTSLQLWGGIECTINRIGDRYFDQLQYSGHYERADDIDRFAALGIKALRYPVLWELHEPQKNKIIDWTFTKKRLERIRELGIVPVAGLVHHGSGPAFTNLLEHDFAEQLADFAGKVAAQFPWIEYYTPVNEPLTTARFSGLYGMWYPHHKSDISFVRMLLNQLKGIVLSMKAIRNVNPAAKLVQTEDLGKTYSTPFLSFQAAFENERRWLTYDVLCGKLVPGCMMYDHFIRLGIPENDLEFFIENPCPPDIMGANYYITSERFLDEHLDNYPAFTHGGNELQQYADIEAIRAAHSEPWGLKVLLREAWERFQLPIAITESHINCSREEQLRWFSECRKDLLQLKEEGLDIRALTAWALLGSFGWNKLLTDPAMTYESGIFDVRSGTPRLTALAQEIISTIKGTEPHPLCTQPGWWKCKPAFSPGPEITNDFNNAASINPVLIFGKTGTLGRAFLKVCTRRNIPFYMAGREDADITDSKQIEMLLLKVKPWAVINAAGFVNIDKAESEVQACYAINTAAPVLMAALCERYGIQFMSFSSDQVFDGNQKRSYIETDAVNPLNVYGSSKVMAEIQIGIVNSGSLIVRTSAFFGPWDSANFAHDVIRSLSQNKPFHAAGDIFVSPTYLPDLVENSLDLLIDKEKGIWHLSNGAATSWARFAKDIAKRLGFNASLIQSTPAQKLGWIAARPFHATLNTNKGILLPSLENALDRYIRDCSPVAKSILI